MQDEIAEELQRLLDEKSDDLSHWAIQFCGDMIRIIEDGYILTEDQLSKAEELIEENS